MRWLILLCLLAAQAGCAVYRDTGAPMATQAIAPARYAGTWVEIASFPVPFQAGCAATQATYTPAPDGTLTVRNTCRAGTPDGPERSIAGSARPVGPGKFRVRLDGVPFAADYWVLWVDARYRTAVVGVPSGRAGWILARDPEIAPAQLAQATAALAAAGYDTDRLVFTDHGAAGP